MFISTLLIDVGGNPDRPRPGRLWLRNPYRVHQRLCMAFPSVRRKNGDPEMLHPYAPEDFADGHVHVRRNDPEKKPAGFLFRIDPMAGGGAIILVQSAIQPDWEYAFRNAGFLLAAPPSEPRPLPLTFAVGNKFRFRLLANATFRARKGSVHRTGQPIEDKWVGKRIGVSGDEESLTNWIARRAGPCGFTVDKLTLLQPGYVAFHRPEPDKPKPREPGVRLRSVRYEGILQVAETERFHAALASGIGSAKAFGFGLLSLARV